MLSACKKCQGVRIILGVLRWQNAARPSSSSTTTRRCATRSPALLRRDLRVLRAAPAKRALQMMEKEDVDLMILDVRLPGISGFEVLQDRQGELPATSR